MYLESMDTARRVPHPSPMRPNAVTRASVLRLSFFFSLGFVPTQLQFAPNWADLARIGPYRPYQVVSAGD